MAGLTYLRTLGEPELSGMAGILSASTSWDGHAGVRSLPLEHRRVVTGMCVCFTWMERDGHVDTFYLEGCLFLEITKYPEMSGIPVKSVS